MELVATLYLYESMNGKIKFIIDLLFQLKVQEETFRILVLKKTCYQISLLTETFTKIFCVIIAI